MVLDSVEKRAKKGYLFMYADEPIFDHVNKSQVKAVFGDTIEKDIPIAEIIEEARRNFNIFLVWPQGGYRHAREQYVKLFGKESVLISQHPNLLCELIASTIGLYEDKVTASSAVTDLVAIGVGDREAKALVKSLGHGSVNTRCIGSREGGSSVRAICIADLAFGDCSKGATVDALCRSLPVDLIVRYNGGCQAAHHVVW